MFLLSRRLTTEDKHEFTFLQVCEGFEFEEDIVMGSCIKVDVVGHERPYEGTLIYASENFDEVYNYYVQVTTQTFVDSMEITRDRIRRIMGGTGHGEEDEAETEDYEIQIDECVVPEIEDMSTSDPDEGAEEQSIYEA